MCVGALRGRGVSVGACMQVRAIGQNRGYEAW